MDISKLNFSADWVQRINIFRGSGNDPQLIKHLLHDAQLLEYLKANLSAQIERLEDFQHQYLDEPSRMTHEMPFIDVTYIMADFAEATQKLQVDVEQRLKSLTQTCQELIALVIHTHTTISTPLLIN